MLVLIDHDGEHDCAPAALDQWAPEPRGFLVVRIVVQAIEVWALGDREGAASFFSVRLGAIPQDPERLDAPKRTLIDLASRSRRREIRRAIEPRRSSGRSQGPGYEGLLIEFGARYWNLERARETCPSLDRAVHRMHTVLVAFGST